MILNAGKLALVPVFGPSTLMCSSGALSGRRSFPSGPRGCPAARLVARPRGNLRDSPLLDKVAELLQKEGRTEPVERFNWNAPRHFPVCWIDAGLTPKTVQTFARAQPAPRRFAPSIRSDLISGRDRTCRSPPGLKPRWSAAAASRQAARAGAAQRRSSTPRGNVRPTI